MLSFFQTVFRCLMLSAAVCQLLSPVAAQAYESSETGIITADRLNVRKATDRTKGIIKILRRGTYVEVLGRLDGWLKISHEGDLGYIRHRDRYVRILEQAMDKGLIERVPTHSLVDLFWGLTVGVIQLEDIKGDNLRNHQFKKEAFKLARELFIKSLSCT